LFPSRRGVANYKGKYFNDDLKLQKLAIDISHAEIERATAYVRQRGFE
jgi:hypothetical protein